MHKKYLKIIALFLILLFSFQLCGFSLFNSTEVAVDTEKNYVYQHISAETLLSEIKSDKKNAKEKYNNSFILLSGMFESADTGSGKLSIINSEYESINCIFDKEQSIDTSDFRFKDRVAVFGKCSFWFDEVRLVEVKKVIFAPVISSSEVYYTLDGISFDKSSSVQRTLNNGKVKFYIPSRWKSIENNISEMELGNIEGYQYVLNKTPDSSDAVPESLFVCYFDKDKLLKEPADIKYTDKVEKAIVENIEGRTDNFSSKSVKTYYGANYHYYHGKFSDDFDMGKGYRTEYIFQPDGDRGLILFLYLYTNTNHISDVMITTRLLEVEE